MVKYSQERKLVRSDLARTEINFNYNNIQLYTLYPVILRRPTPFLTIQIIHVPWYSSVKHPRGLLKLKKIVIFTSLNRPFPFLFCKKLSLKRHNLICLCRFCLYLTLLIDALQLSLNYFLR